MKRHVVHLHVRISNLTGGDCLSQTALLWWRAKGINSTSNGFRGSYKLGLVNLLGDSEIMPCKQQKGWTYVETLS